MPVTLRPIRLKGAREYSAALAQVNPKRNPALVRRALVRIGALTQRTVRERYLRGPAPRRLDRRTGRLAGSIYVDPARLPHAIEIGVDSDLWWAENYELGKGPRGSRPFIKPAVRDVLRDAERIVLDEWRRSVE